MRAFPGRIDWKGTRTLSVGWTLHKLGSRGNGRGGGVRKPLSGNSSLGCGLQEGSFSTPPHPPYPDALTPLKVRARQVLRPLKCYLRYICHCNEKQTNKQTDLLSRHLQNNKVCPHILNNEKRSDKDHLSSQKAAIDYFHRWWAEVYWRG